MKATLEEETGSCLGKVISNDCSASEYVVCCVANLLNMHAARRLLCVSGERLKPMKGFSGPTYSVSALPSDIPRNEVVLL